MRELGLLPARRARSGVERLCELGKPFLREMFGMCSAVPPTDRG